MTFTTVPVQVAGPSSESRSRTLSSQSTINFYQEFAEGNRSNFALQSWPGQTVFGSTGVEGADRGMKLVQNATEPVGTLYRVVGTRLYSVDVNGAHTDRGLIRGDGRCTFATDGIDLFIVNQGFVQLYDTSIDALSDVTDSNIIGSIAVDFINNQFIYTKPDLFVISDPGDGSSASGLNAAQAESQPDELVRAYVFKTIVYMMGSSTTEPWWNNGTGNPPFQRIEKQITSVGLGSLHCITSTDNFMYWLGDDRQIYQVSSNTHARISTIAIANAIEGYDDVSDSLAYNLTFQGQNFIIFSFPSANKTWVLNESLGENGWFEISADNDSGKYNATSFSLAYSKNLIADDSTGDLYELDINAYLNNDDTIQRVRTLSAIDGEALGQRGKRIQMSRFELIVDQGVGLIDGLGVNPRIMIEASYDGGKSFAHGEWARIGRLGETQLRVEWWSMRSFYDIIIRITTSDPVQYTILSGAIDLRLAGR